LPKLCTHRDRCLVATSPDGAKISPADPFRAPLTDRDPPIYVPSHAAVVVSWQYLVRLVAPLQPVARPALSVEYPPLK